MWKSFHFCCAHLHICRSHSSDLAGQTASAFEHGSDIALAAATMSAADAASVGAFHPPARASAACQATNAKERALKAGLADAARSEEVIRRLCGRVKH